MQVATVGGSATSYRNSNLYSSSYYCYRVAAVSNVGTGPYSDEECESTTGQWVPTDPPILRLSSVSPTSVTIAWDPPKLTGGRPVTGYVFEASPFDDNCEYGTHDRDLWPENKCFLVSASQRTRNFSGLTPGEEHSFRVRTETAYEDSIDWSVVTAHLPLAARDDPDTPNVTEDLQVRLSTTSLTVHEGRTASYTVRLNKAPQENETVTLNWDLDNWSDISLDYEDERRCTAFGGFTRDNWSRGCTITLLAEEDTDSEDVILRATHTIEVGGREVSGPDVKVVVQDND